MTCYNNEYGSAVNMKVSDLNPDKNVCHRVCAFTLLHTSQRPPLFNVDLVLWARTLLIIIKAYSAMILP